MSAAGPSYNRLIGTPSNTSVTVGNTSTLVLADRPQREHAVITNDSDEKIYLSFGEAAVIGSGVPLAPNGGSYTTDYTALWTREVYAICASGGRSLSIFQV